MIMVIIYIRNENYIIMKGGVNNNKKKKRTKWSYSHFGDIKYEEIYID